MRARDLLLGLPLAAALLWSPSPARACGGFFQDAQSADVVAVSDVRVLLVKQQDLVHQYVQVGYKGDTRRFAWVYPVAGNPQVLEVTSSPFTSLEEQTRPRITIVTPHESSGGGGFGCLGAAGDMAPSLRGGTEVAPPVKVWQSGRVGAFDYVVITASVAREMLDWLQSNGFAVPQTTAPVLDHYLSLGWFFVAMKISVEKVAAEVPATTVIRLSYPAKELRYPLKMVSLSAAAETRLEIYVINNGGVQPSSPFAALTMQTAQLRATSSSTHNYEEVFEAMVKARPRGLLWEFASRDWLPAHAGLSDQVEPSSTLTRYRTVLTPADLVDDLRFVPSSGLERKVEVQLTFVDGGQSAGLPAPLGLLGLAYVLWGALRRRRQAR